MLYWEKCLHELQNTFWESVCVVYPRKNFVEKRFWSFSMLFREESIRRSWSRTFCESAWQQEIPRILECKFKGGLTESEKHSDLRPEDPHFFLAELQLLPVSRSLDSGHTTWRFWRIKGGQEERRRRKGRLRMKGRKKGRKEESQSFEETLWQKVRDHHSIDENDELTKVENAESEMEWIQRVEKSSRESRSGTEKSSHRKEHARAVRSGI